MYFNMATSNFQWSTWRTHEDGCQSKFDLIVYFKWCDFEILMDIKILLKQTMTEPRDWSLPDLHREKDLSFRDFDFRLIWNSTDVDWEDVFSKRKLKLWGSFFSLVSTCILFFSLNFLFEPEMKIWASLVGIWFSFCLIRTNYISFYSVVCKLWRRIKIRKNITLTVLLRV